MRDWGKESEYLHSTRRHLWNNDYFEFLVKCVWKIDKPVKIIDFGCGYGYLAQLFLPIIPKGSTYKGIDISEQLIENAKEIFYDNSESVSFEVADLNDYKPTAEYDVVICQAVLRHLPNPVQILKKMIDTAKDGGLVICTEPSRRLENAGVYIDSTDFYPFKNDDYLEQKWIKEIKSGGRDYQIGIKLPIVMERLGLKNIGVRINDYVDYVRSEDKDEISRFLSDHDVDSEFSDSNGFVAARCHVISYGNK